MNDIPEPAPKPNPAPKTASKLPRRIAMALGIAFLIAQFIPYGRAHQNPPIASEPAWDSPETKATFDKACADCHSHRTVWPWYSHIAPVSWLVQRDVDVGRSEFNISAPPGSQGEADEAAKAVRKGEMPMAIYTVTHRDAILSAQETQVFVNGLTKTFGGEGGSGKGEGKQGGDRDDD